MTWDITDRFPDWGETGESPPTGFFYEGGDQVNEKHLDYLWNSVKGLEDDVQSALNDIDSDGDGKVDAAENADDADNATNVTSTYKGNDIDSDGDGKVDAADDVTVAKLDGKKITIPSVNTNNQDAGVVIGDEAKIEENTAEIPSTSRYGVAIGHAAQVQRDADGASTNAIALGSDCVSKGEYAVSVGYNADAKMPEATAIGSFTNATGAEAIVIGNGAEASGGRSCAIGDGFTEASGTSAYALGIGATASGDGAYALGFNVSSPNNNEIVLGENDQTTTYQVKVDGDLSVTGSKPFVIDHPSKPDTHDLRHTSYEGPVSGGLVYNATVDVTDTTYDISADLPDYVSNGDFGKNWTTHVTASDHFGNGYVDADTWTLHVEQSGKYEVTIFGERTDQGALQNGGERMEKPKGEDWAGNPKAYWIEYDAETINTFDSVSTIKVKYDHGANCDSIPCETAVDKYSVRFTDNTKATFEPSELETHNNGEKHIADASELVEKANNK
jgi:hypothetical protein